MAPEMPIARAREKIKRLFAATTTTMIIRLKMAMIATHQMM
jgi:hypothetical protein